MKRFLIFALPFVLLAVTVSLLAVQAPVLKRGLPKTYYRAKADDPEWLAAAAQFHGHLGPALVFGCWAGMAALDAVDARGYFDIEVTAQGPFAKPPQSCILDGLQVATGATLGKRNLTVVEAEEYVITVKNRRTGASVEIRPTPELLKLMAGEQLGQHDEDDDDDHDDGDDIDRAEAAGRRLLDMSQDSLMTIKTN